MPVNSSLHPQYKHGVEQWTLVRNVVENNAKPMIRSIPSRNKEQNARYKSRAVLTNFTERTRNALLGAVFSKDTMRELPPELEYVLDDVTGWGINLEQLERKVVSELLVAGRIGLLADYPQAEEGLTQAQVNNLGLEARIHTYEAENIVNWYVGQVNGRQYLEMVVLKECIDELSDDGFEYIKKTQYRVLRMQEGVYVQHLYDEVGDFISEHTPRMSNGATFDEIPFVCIGSEDNDMNIDKAPLLDLANLNIAHLNNSADLEESIHVSGLPTWAFAPGMSQEDYALYNPEGLQIGALGGVIMATDGHLSVHQADLNLGAKQGMDAKMQDAIMMGARLIQPQSGVETAEAAKIRNASEHSVLSVIVKNASEGLRDALRYLAMFMGGNPDLIEIDINMDFYDGSLNAQDIMAAIQMYQAGIVPREDMVKVARRAELIDEDRDLDDVLGELEQESPLSGVLDVNNDIP